MTVDELMTRRIVSVEMDDTLRVIYDIFNHSNFHHLLVVDRGKLRGVISDRDLFKAISHNIGSISETEKDTASLNKKAHQIMSRHPHTLTVDADLHAAIDLLKHHSVSCIPIVDVNDEPVGILSWRDLLTTIELQQTDLTVRRQAG